MVEQYGQVEFTYFDLIINYRRLLNNRTGANAQRMNTGVDEPSSDLPEHANDGR